MTVVTRLGQRVPDFALPDSDGKLVRLSDLCADGYLVIAFFPFAFSGVCDKEMCAFRDEFAGLSETGLRVAGISVDSVFTLKVFKQTYDLPFPLLSDFNKKVAKAYGVLDDVWVAHGYRGVAKRSAFVVDKKCILRYRWVADSPGQEPPYEALTSAVEKT